MAGRRTRRPPHTLLLVVALLPVLAGCTIPGGGQHYLPANAAVDPYGAVRARAQQFYQAGSDHERQGDWRQALDDYQQARLWDPDNRRDIQDALSRAQARVGATSSAALTAPPTAQRAAGPTPTVSASQAGMRAFQSQSFPYAIAYPEGWLAKPGGTSQQPIDTFVGQPARNVAAVVLITEESITSGATLDEVFAATVRQLRSTGINDVQIADRRQVGGLPAYGLAYYVRDDSGTAAARHAIFVTPGNAWHVILLATPGTTPDLLKTFDAMLDSLRLLSPAFPQA